MKAVKTIIVLALLGAAGYAAWNFRSVWLPQVLEIFGAREEAPAPTEEPVAEEVAAEPADEPEVASEPVLKYSPKELKWLEQNLLKPFKATVPATDDAVINPAYLHMPPKGRAKFMQLSSDEAARLRYRVSVPVKDVGQVEIGSCKFGEELSGQQLRRNLVKALKPDRTLPTGEETAFGAVLTGPTLSEVKAQAEEILKTARLTVTPTME